MTKTFAALVLATLVATPAMAATRHHVRATNVQTESTEGAFAYAPIYSEPSISDTGNAIGTDPDPNVRLQLLRQGDNNWSN